MAEERRHEPTTRGDEPVLLPQSEGLYRALIHHLNVVVVVLDRSGRLIYGAPAMEELTGYTFDEWAGRDALEFVHPDDREVVAQAFANTVAAPGMAVPLRFRLVARDGSTTAVEVTATNLLEDPIVAGVVVTLRDITAAPEGRTALEVSESRFRKMIENISDTVTLIGADGQVVDTTGQIKEILGYPTEFWDVRSTFDIAHPDDAERARRRLAQLLAEPGVEVTDEFRARHADGSWAIVELTASNLLDDPDVGAIVITSRNITSRKLVEEELASARDQALRALEQKTEFVASVSHELRTPIHGILGLSELLERSDLDEETRTIAQSIGRAGESMRMVLDDLLDFSRIEAGRLELDSGPVVLREVFDDVVRLFGPQAERKGITLVAEIDPALPDRVQGDALRIRQVVSNLVANAVKFTQQGTVTIRANRELGPDDTFGLGVAVHDTGIGIGSDDLDRLFEPFTQAHRSTARRFGGTGLGLTIAMRLVELMGGSLSVQSEPGLGSVFTFVVPLMRQSHEAEPDRDRDTELGRAPTARRVLVVEDNPVNQMLVRRQLERLGYDPLVVDNGTDALERFEEVDAVLMDWQMPGLDGLETARRLRLREVQGRRVPVIAMTASVLPGDRARCLEAGMDDFIAKPVNLATLGSTLHRWLPDRPAVTPPRMTPPVAGREGALDTSALRRLSDELDDLELLATVVRTYLRELPVRVASIEQAVSTGDTPTLGSVAHTLKSTSAAVGAVHLSSICAQLEAAASSGEDAARIAPELAEHARALAEALNGYLAAIDAAAQQVQPASSTR